MGKSNSGDIRYCNCAGCGTELLGDSSENLAIALRYYRFSDLPRMVTGRIMGRPYCLNCLQVRKIPSRPATFDKDGSSPYQDNAIRDMEDGRGDG